MKPEPFRYVRPADLSEALRFLTEHGEEAKPIAGGQSLMPMLNLRLARLEYLVDILRLPGMDGMETMIDGSLSVGAMVRHRDLVMSRLIREKAPLIAECAPLIGHPAIRNRGTLGGSIVHADPAAELPTALVALDARIHLTSASDARELPACDFFQGIFTTATRPDELVVRVTIPPVSPRTGWAFLEMARRHGDFALVGAAAVMTLGSDDRCTGVRLVLAGVAGGPFRSPEAEESLTHRPLSPRTLSEAAQIATASLRISGDMHASSDYRRQAARVYAERALNRAWQRAQTMEKA